MSQVRFRRSPSGTGARSRVGTVVLSALLVAGLAHPAFARKENALLTVIRNCIYGAASGLFLGGVSTLVVDEDQRDDVLRWGVVIGTYAGFAYGIYRAETGTDEEFSARMHNGLPLHGVPQPPRRGRRGIGRDAAASLAMDRPDYGRRTW